jgi:hypothetical protein
MVRTPYSPFAKTDGVVYPVQGFTAYVVISIIWLFLGGFMVGIYPLWEARKGIWGVSLLYSTVMSVG